MVGAFTGLGSSTSLSFSSILMSTEERAGEGGGDTRVGLARRDFALGLDFAVVFAFAFAFALGLGLDGDGLSWRGL